jgi:hypothetical protein
MTTPERDRLAALLHEIRGHDIDGPLSGCRDCPDLAARLLAANVRVGECRCPDYWTRQYQTDHAPECPLANVRVGEAGHQHRFDVVIRDDAHMRLLGCSNSPCSEVYQWDW